MLFVGTLWTWTIGASVFVNLVYLDSDVTIPCGWHYCTSLIKYRISGNMEI